MANIRLLQPVEGDPARIISQRFGNKHPRYDSAGMAGHEGVDYALPEGTPIRAAMWGWIRKLNRLENNPKHAYGNHLRLLHISADGVRFETIYAHLSGFVQGVREGFFVAPGALIGYVGNTGNSTGPHLHFSVKLWDGQGAKGYPAGVIDPLPFIVQTWQEIEK